jgi:hypothetical protein
MGGDRVLDLPRGSDDLDSSWLIITGIYMGWMGTRGLGFGIMVLWEEADAGGERTVDYIR